MNDKAEGSDAVNNPKAIIRIGGKEPHELVWELYPDGSINKGPLFPGDDMAAMQFFDAITKMAPGFLAPVSLNAYCLGINQGAHIATDFKEFIADDNSAKSQHYIEAADMIAAKIARTAFTMNGGPLPPRMVVKTSGAPLGGGGKGGPDNVMA